MTFWTDFLEILVALAHKLFLFLVGLFYVCRGTGNDKRLTYPKYDPGKDLSPENSRTKTLILIRHAESTWNEAINRGINLQLPLRLLYAFVCEMLLLITPDSHMFDAPLSEKGMKQSMDLNEFLTTC